MAPILAELKKEYDGTFPVEFIDEQGRISTRRAFLIALLFSVGSLITIGRVGVATAAADRM